MPQLRHRPRDLIQGRYEVRKLLGSGAFGTVYGCMDSELSAPVAAKELHVLDENGTERASALTRFRAEALHLSALNHPHIVRGHYQRDNGHWRVCPICGLDFPQLTHCPDHNAALWSVESRHYLVMEYIGGADLLRLLEQSGGTLPLGHSIEWMKQIASALAHVHAKHFVHRDIKPENIHLRAVNAVDGAGIGNDRTVDGETEGHVGEAVLLDFGIATQGEDATGDKYGTRPSRGTTGGGTQGYAPENPQEASAPDARSDVHAFGMTWIHLLCGLDPTDANALRRIRSHTPRDFRPEIPDWLDELLAACISYEPDDRPQNGRELLELLENPRTQNQRADLDQDRTQTQWQGQSQGNGGGSWQGQSGVTAGGTTVLGNTGSHPVAPMNLGAPTTPVPVMNNAVANMVSTVVPLQFRSGHYTRHLEDLLWLCDAYPDEAARKLATGDIEKWLHDSGNEHLARRAREVRTQFPSQRAALEAWIQETGMVPRPELSLSRTVLDFGALKNTEQKSVDIKIHNTGRGFLFGRVHSSHGNLSTTGAFEGNKTKIPVSFDAFRLRPGRYEGTISLDGSMGQVDIPWTAKVRGPSAFVPFLVVLLNGLYGMASGGLLRSVPFEVSPTPALTNQWLTSLKNLPWAPISPVFGLVLAALLFVWTVTFAAFRRSCGALLSLGLLGTIVSVYAFAAGNTLLVSGDHFLKPIFKEIVHDHPAGGWMFAGALGGAMLASLWRWKDLMSNRFWAVMLGFLTTMAMVYFALAGAAGVGRVHP